MRLPQITHITLCVSNRCNLRCPYCYVGRESSVEKPSNMSVAVARRTCDFFISQLRNGRTKSGYITFFGGEPLLNWGLIKSVVKYVEKKSRKYGLKILFMIVTNGTLIDSRKIDFVRAHDITMGISIDSWDEVVNNVLRPSSAKLNTFNRVIQSLKSFNEEDRVFIRSTITKQNTDIFKFVKYFSNFRAIKEILWGKVVAKDERFEWGMQELRVYKNAMKKYAEYIIKNWRRGVEMPLHGSLGEAMIKVTSSGKKNHGPNYCGGGRESIAVSVDGNFYSCEALIGADDFYLGSVYEGIDNKRRLQLLRKLSINNKPKCLSCRLKNACGGGCYYASYFYKGDVNKCDKMTCEEMKIKYRIAELLSKSKPFYFDITR